MDESGPYDVVLLPEASLAQRVIALNHQMPADRLITLEHWQTVPHMSLYMFELKHADRDRAAAVVAQIAEGTRLITAQAARFNSSHGFLMLDYVKTAAIAELQEQVVAGLNPLRNGLRDKDLPRLQQASTEVRANFEAYGWGSIGRHYHPHLTVTRHANEQALNGVSLPDPQEFSGRFTELGLVETGEHGTAAKIIAKFSLKEA